MELKAIFPTIVARDNRQFDIMPTVELIRQHEVNRIRSNRGGQQFPCDSETYSGLKELCNWVEEISNNYARDIGLPVRLKIGDSWMNVNNYKDYNQTHTHPGCLVSAVYYAKMPGSSNDSPYNEGESPGRLAFQRDDSMNHYYAPLNMLNNTIYADAFFVTPEVGDLIMFPPWLRHNVEQNTTKNSRISFAFNLIDYNIPIGKK